MNLPPVGHLPQGTVLYQGRFRIDLLLANAPQRAVYRAWDLTRDRAATILELATPSEEQANAALQRAAPLVQLDHPTITPFQVIFVEQNTVFIGMGLPGGQTLDRIMAERNAPIAPAAAVRWIVQAAEALEFLGRELPDWHLGDVSAAALLVTAEDRIQVLGFEMPLGLITPEAIAANLPPGLVAPELRQGQCDARADVYALAATLHLLLTRRAWQS
nr:protein kinase [Ktedonobacterales bacterium]